MKCSQGLGVWVPTIAPIRDTQLDSLISRNVKILNLNPSLAHDFPNQTAIFFLSLVCTGKT